MSLSSFFVSSSSRGDRGNVLPAPASEWPIQFPGISLHDDQVNSDSISAWPEIQAHIQARPRTFLCLGFDGVLSPLEAHANDAELSEEIRNLLTCLQKTSRLSVAIISGRSVTDLRNRVPIPGIIFAGNHGTEFDGAGLVASDGIAASCRSDLVDAIAFLTRFTRKIPGVQVEDKGLSLTVHWRQAGSGERAILKELMDCVLKQYPRLRVFAGEATWDVRARASWNKVDAILQILDHLGLSTSDTIYVGAGQMDEGTFARLSGALTFSTGECADRTAKYALTSAADLMQLLFSVLYAANRVSKNHSSTNP